MTERYLSLLDHLGQAAIATSISGEIMLWNQAATELYGWRADEVIGRNIVDVTPGDISRGEAEAIMAALGAGEVWSGEFPVRDRTGARFLASVTDVPLLDASSKVVGIIGISARSHGPTRLRKVLERIGEVAETLWPGRVLVRFGDGDDPVIAASEPHVTQLLTLLMLRHGGTFETEGVLEISMEAATPRVLSDLGLLPYPQMVYVRITRSSRPPGPSMLEDVLRSSERSGYAFALVHSLGGTLFVGAAPFEGKATHLLLPQAA